MSTKGEIITLQFGNYSNYIGAHWWNLQESSFNYDPEATPSEINHDVLYREGINLTRQTTYTPRLLLVDLDGSLKHMPQDGELYGNNLKRTASPLKQKSPSEDVKKLRADLEYNDTNMEVVEAPEAPKTDFQRDLEMEEVDFEEKDYNLTNTVDSWVDFLYARYHPRTVNIIKEYKHVPERQTFDTYPSGVTLWKTEQFEEEFCDNIRRYVEECDHMQGFQTLFDCFNGHAGLAVQCLEHLNDEYTKTIFALPIFSPVNTLYENAGKLNRNVRYFGFSGLSKVIHADGPLTDSIRVVNSALAFSQLSEQSSLFVPLSTQARVWRQMGSARSIRALNYQPDNLYHTSAILAAYLDTISLRYRLRGDPLENTLSGFCADLSHHGRKLTAAALALPFPMQQSEDLIDCLDKFEGNLFNQLTPNCQIGTNYVIQSLCMRGIPSDRLKRPLEHAQLQMRMAAYKCSSVSEMLQLYLQCTYHASMAHVSAIASAMPTRLPFPSEIFNETVNCKGFISVDSKRGPSNKVNSVPILASIQSSGELGDMLDTLHREAKRVKVAKLHRFRMAGLEDDEYECALENLLQFASNYNDNIEL